MAFARAGSSSAATWTAKPSATTDALLARAPRDGGVAVTGGAPVARSLVGAVVGTCDAAAAVVDRGAAALDAAGLAPGFCGAPPRGGNTLRVSGRFSTATAKSISTAS